MVPITIRTRFTPAVTVSPGVGQGGSGQGAFGELLTFVLQPEVSSGPLVYAPAGRPGEQWVVWVGLAALGLVFMTTRLLRRR